MAISNLNLSSEEKLAQKMEADHVQKTRLKPNSGQEVRIAAPKKKLVVTKKIGSKEVDEEVKKFTSKLVNLPSDPPVNKVGYYFTRREIDQLNNLVTRLKPILRDKFNCKVTKNDVLRACLAIGLEDWEENQLTSKLVNLLTSK